jgi:hypothetical protein
MCRPWGLDSITTAPQLHGPRLRLDLRSDVGLGQVPRLRYAKTFDTTGIERYVDAEISNRLCGYRIKKGGPSGRAAFLVRLLVCFAVLSYALVGFALSHDCADDDIRPIVGLSQVRESPYAWGET